MASRALRADVVIVGAGSAGCALAARLSENPDRRVILVEAGGRPCNPWIDVPIGYFKTVGHPSHDWRFETDPESELDDRRVPWPRGKGLGGTSLINGMLYLRGHRDDYDEWARQGNRGWSWNEVLPYFQRAAGPETIAGETSGPLAVSRLPRDPLSDAFIEAAGLAGVPGIEDFNQGENHGAGYFRMTVKSGRRVSTARGYLQAARHRPNLAILTRARALRLKVHKGRATGVEVLVRGRPAQIEADSEVVLSAGAVQSPQLLQLSGIGDPQLLGRLGVPLVAALPGVGQNLQDHLQVRLLYRCEGAETLNDVAHSWRLKAREAARYLLQRTGALAYGIYRAGAFLHAGPGDGRPDIQAHFGLVSFDRPHQPPHRLPGVTLSACILRPSSRGRIEAASADPLVAPRIAANYLRAHDDRDLAVRAVRRMREIAAQPPLARYLREELDPGAAANRDADVLAWIRRRAVSIFHPVGTCRMGPDNDAGAVVDPELRVRGIDGLRVVDGSVMPSIVSGNTNAPIIMIAERAADLIRR